ncbi:MAG: hypothetical protein V7607_5804 [Solirubrobacteraceae bacterium]
MLDWGPVVHPRRHAFPLRSAIVAVVLVLATGAPASAAQLFAPSSFWNTRLSPQASIAPNSQSLVADLDAQVTSEGAWINTYQYSVPVYTVAASQPTVRVQLDAGYAPLQADFAEVPLPPNARPAPGADAHLSVFQPSTDTLWDFWKVTRAADGWHARWGGKMRNVSRDAGYFPDPVGATGSGLPLLGGLIRIDELTTGVIDHALALGIPEVKAQEYVWPAQRTDGASTNPQAIPEGTRFRLDPNLDVNALGLPPVARMMALAAQRYGIVVRDVAGAVTFYGEDPGPSGSNPYPSLYSNLSASQLLAGFPWSSLRVVSISAASGVPARIGLQ